MTNPGDEVCEALRAVVDRIMERRRLQSGTWRSGRHFPSDYSRGWHDGHTTAMASIWLELNAALDPEGAAKHDEDMQASGWASDREWFERTGCCGHCGNMAEDCVCTDADPCDCGPHPERRTWPRDCGWCKGTGTVEPFHAPVPASVSGSPTSENEE